MKSMNNNKEKVKKRVSTFIDTLNLAANELTRDLSSRKSLTTTIQILSRIRNQGPGKSSNGLILLDQYFSVP